MAIYMSRERVRMQRVLDSHLDDGGGLCSTCGQRMPCTIRVDAAAWFTGPQVGPPVGYRRVDVTELTRLLP